MVILFAKKRLLSSISALGDMVRDIWDNYSGDAGHGFILVKMGNRYRVPRFPDFLNL